MNGDYHFDHAEFRTVSDECKDLIRKLLTVDQTRRVDAPTALKHPWFKKCKKGVTAEVQQIDDQVISRLRSFKGVSTFKKAAMNLLVKSFSGPEVADLKAQF